MDGRNDTEFDKLVSSGIAITLGSECDWKHYVV